MTPTDPTRPLSAEEEAVFREGLRDLPDMASAEALSLLEITRREWMHRCARLLATLDAERAGQPSAALREALEPIIAAYHVIEHHSASWKDCPLDSCTKARAALSPAPAPKRDRIDWSNVVVDEGDEAP